MSVKTYDYTPKGTEPSGTPVTKSFTYNTSRPDRLTRFITYSSMGCPTTFNGMSATWTRGKLAQLSKGTFKTGMETFAYDYNALGQRVSKSYTFTPPTTGLTQILEGQVTQYSKKYYYDNAGRLLAVSSSEVVHGVGNTSNTIKFIYDESGMIGFEYSNGTNENVYYYQRNLLGDVVAIYDTIGNKVVEYAYDAWGNCTIKSTTTNYPLANANPIRYRGYYFDEDTNLYYLNARYYSPEFRRFISPDDTNYLDPESVNGLNLYCYCNNDPINFVDPSGHFPILAVILGLTAAVGLGLTVGGVASDDNLMTAIGLTMVAAPALIIGGLTTFASTGALAIGVGATTMVSGGLTSIFAAAEYQEAFTGQNFILNTGIGESWYNGLMLTTAGLATLGTVASSFAYHFNINSIDKIGTLEGTNYKGIRFTQKVQRAGGRKVTLYRTLEWHTHSHLGYNPHWQINIFSKNGGIWLRGNALNRWTWWLTKI